MARPVRVRESYTGDRSRLSRLEIAVEKDPRLNGEQRSGVTELIHKLISALMDLDSKLPPLPHGEANGKRRRRKVARAAIA